MLRRGAGHPRARIARAWTSAFTTINLNERNPPVWMQVAPQGLSYGGYAIAGHQLRLRLGMTALTATVIARALAKWSRRPFMLPALGAVMARFDHITLYGATGGRIAVGADIDAQPSWNTLPPIRGRLWFVAVRVNAPGSQQVHFRDLTIEGATNHSGSDLLVKLANNPGFADAIAGSLTQNFTKDFGDFLGKIQRALAAKRQGDFIITAHVDGASNGQLQAAANGLYMPVTLAGTAAITYQPVGR